VQQQWQFNEDVLQLLLAALLLLLHIYPPKRNVEYFLFDYSDNIFVFCVLEEKKVQQRKENEKFLFLTATLACC